MGTSLKLADKVILVTGGSTGIGLECARAYAREGANVAIIARCGDSSRSAAVSLGVQHLGFGCDVSQGDQVEAAIDRTLERYGRIDAIHNNAGIAHPTQPLHETTEAEWDTLFDVNVKSVFHTTRFAYQALKQSKGCILNTSSLVGVIGQEDHAVYTATKGAMNTLTKSMALDYAPDGIRVNAICPAGVRTPMLDSWAASLDDVNGINKYLDDIHPLGSCPGGDVIADAALFLVSADARFVTGHIMHVSGGAELGYRRLPDATLAKDTL